MIGTFTILACGKVSSQQQQTGQGALINMKDVTDTSSCTGTSSASIYGSWHQMLHDNYHSETLYLNISATFTTVNAQCTYSDNPTPVGTQPFSVNSQVTTSEYTVQQTQSASQASGSDVPCVATIDAGQYSYSFKGPCLVLTGNGMSITYLP